MRPEDVVTTDTGMRMLRAVTPIYNDDEYQLSIFNANGLMMHQVLDAVEELKSGMFIQNATWSLPYWEQLFRIKTTDNQTIEQRRRNITLKMNEYFPVTRRRMEFIVDSFTEYGGVSIDDNRGDYSFKILFLNSGEVDFDAMKRTVEEIKPAHLKAYYLLKDTLEIYYKLFHEISSRVKVRTSSNPWSQAGLGNTADEILLDGEYLLDGNRFLNGFYNKDGPAHMQKIKLASKVLHEFGVHEVNVMPSLDGEFHLDGEILLQNEPQNKKLVVLHDARMRYTQREIIEVSSQHSVPIKSSTSTSNGVASLDGQVNLDGTMSLDQALYNHSGLFRVKKDGETVEEVAI